MKRVPGGEQELTLLRYIAENGPLTVGETFDLYGAAQGLARSTVLTMMERLRGKGHLLRRRVDGVFQYASKSRPDELLRDVVGNFVERSLNGSVTPFVSWLAESSAVSDAELEQLEDLVRKLKVKSTPAKGGAR